MRIEIKTKYLKQGPAYIEFSRYVADNSIAIKLNSSAGEPLLVATSCLHEYGIKPKSDDCVFLKDYSENAGIGDALVKAGILEPMGYGSEIVFATHTVTFPCYRLTDKAIEEFNRQMPKNPVTKINADPVEG